MESNNKEFMQSRVNVLISTYNGGDYIEDQIKSIINQTYPNIHIYIRDDGSTDETCEKLAQFEKHDNITVFYGERIGYGRSFLTLLEMADNGQYWAFCDQDDYWIAQKVEKAVNWLDEQDSRVPCLFHSAYYNCNEALDEYELVTCPNYRFDFPKAITQCIFLGFSQVMNATLRKLVLRGNKDNLLTHDWWTQLVAVKYGFLEYDNTPMTYHRRLDASVSKNSMKKRAEWFLKAWKGNAEIRSCATEFERVFGYNKDDRDSVVLHWFCAQRYNLLNSLKKAFYPHMWRPSFSSEVTIRLLMLFGKI